MQKTPSPETLAIENSGQQFIGIDFRSLLGPGVYVFTLGETVLYVGSSRCVLGRASQRKHLQAVQARNECDKVLLYPCRNNKDARKLESILISRLNPTYNRRQRHSYVRSLLGVTRDTQSLRM